MLGDVPFFVFFAFSFFDDLGLGLGGGFLNF